MPTRLHAVLAAVLAAIVLGAGGCTETDPAAEAPRELTWPDLIPPEEREQIAALREGRAGPGATEGFPAREDQQIRIFNVVEELDGERVRMPGFILPLDYAERGSAREFLFLPYHGACVHYPAPPPNQVVYLTSEEPIRFDELWDPVWIEGVLTVSRTETDLAAAAYAMTPESVEPYEP
ncbi:DUF3299 domain-containing protein [Marinicauda salina]|uniref:DUF3299 domain-containing protein n=1 Tax=Marinicauda salina TaxID=2135793 RepID=A0A2U2BRV8_9PROT|nr:DUF3299 domain-containing protein [Marinicauda salina]PWE16732.1 DUF3299 domain-containing protein [Marinicauda salina]